MEEPSVMPADTANINDPDILGLTADSRAVRPGFLFAALPGSKANGLDFVDQAVAKGAAAVLAPSGTKLKSYTRPPLLLTADNPRRRLARLAARFSGAQPEHVVACTGTSGKTSVASFTQQIWQALGYKAASLGTLGLLPPRPDAPKSLTTPDPVELHACLAALARGGVDHLVMEASSHGLDQYRLDGVKIEAAAFTNLSRDHLDYHDGMASYLAAKLRLFKELVRPGGTAVINLDSPEAPEVREACAERALKIIGFGAGPCDLRLLEQTPNAQGQALTLEVFGRAYKVDMKIAGTFQAANALAALGLVLACGGKEAAAVEALSNLKGVPGRLEAIGKTPSGGQVYVDYAHKPGALEAVLQAVRPHTPNKLWVVLGCGGDRDRGKRPMMGEIAARLADKVIVTDDNPRTEDAAAIRRAVMEAAPGAQEIGGREDAISTAVAGLARGDTLIIAGKGHESGQTIGDMTIPFDDRDAARAAIAGLSGVRQ